MGPHYFYLFLELIAKLLQPTCNFVELNFEPVCDPHFYLFSNHYMFDPCDQIHYIFWEALCLIVRH